MSNMQPYLKENLPASCLRDSHPILRARVVRTKPINRSCEVPYEYSNSWTTSRLELTHAHVVHILNEISSSNFFIEYGPRATEGHSLCLSAFIGSNRFAYLRQCHSACGRGGRRIHSVFSFKGGNFSVVAMATQSKTKQDAFDGTLLVGLRGFRNTYIASVSETNDDKPCISALPTRVGGTSSH